MYKGFTVYSIKTKFAGVYVRGETLTPEKRKSKTKEEETLWSILYLYLEIIVDFSTCGVGFNYNPSRMTSL